MGVFVNPFGNGKPYKFAVAWTVVTAAQWSDAHRRRLPGQSKQDRKDYIRACKEQRKLGAYEVHRLCRE
jgi:hypothetical protein